MPWKTAKQERWGNSPAGKEAMGQEKVDEFNQASKGLKLPDHVKKHPKGHMISSVHDKGMK